MSIYKYSISFVLFCFIVTVFLKNTAKANDVSFTLTGPKVVAVGEQFQITFALNNNASSFNPGSMEGFQVIGGPYTSQSSSIQIINGDMTKTETYSYSYYLRALKEGKFTIGPGQATIKKKGYNSNSVSIEVVKGASSAQTQQSPQSGQSQQQNQTQTSSQGSGNDLYIKLLLNKSNVYAGEQIIATVKIYTKQNISSLDNFNVPAFSGFYKEDIETPPLRNLERENVGGEIYYTGVLYRAALTPQKNGEITIEPVKLDVLMQQRVNTGRSRSIFDDFFGSQYRTIRRTLESKPVRVYVKSLPKPAPSGFSGATGNFKVSSTLSPLSIKTNDAITYRIKVTGSGNIKLLDNPKITLPPSLEVYDPKISKNLKTTISGTSGEVIYEYLIIPRYAGEFDIPSVNFTYFDVGAKSYKTLSTSSYKITVDKGSDSASTTVVSGLSKEELKYVGKDIRYIKTSLPNFKQKGYYLVKQLGFYLVYLAFFVLFLLLVLIRKKIQHRNADIALVKNRKARNIAHKRLKLARVYVKQNNVSGFYDEILKALWGYISDKLTIPAAELSQDKAINMLEGREISNKTIDKFKKVIDIAELAKYAPSAVDFSLNEVYENAAELISKIEEEVKK